MPSAFWVDWQPARPVAATRAATDEQLAAQVVRLVEEKRRQGTTTVEVKSGYGLTVRDEARSLAIARQVTPETTFLGAHVVPPEHADDPATEYVPAAHVEQVDAPAEEYFPAPQGVQEPTMPGEELPAGQVLQADVLPTFAFCAVVPPHT